MTVIESYPETLGGAISSRLIRGIRSEPLVNRITTLVDVHDDDETIEYVPTGDRIVVSTSSDAPAWCSPVAESLARLLQLEANWDSYGAPPINAHEAAGLLGLLNDVMRRSTPAPAIVPTSRGGVQAEWHRNGVDLEIETLRPSRFHVAFSDSTGNEWDAEVASDLSQLTPIISRLS